MALETLTTPLEIKLASNTDTGEFTGYGSFFGNTDRHGDVVYPGAFVASLAERKARGFGLPSMNFNHGLPEIGGERAIGVWSEMVEDTKGLRVRGRISGMNTDRGRHYFERLKDGAIGGLSIGFAVRPNGAEFVKGANGSRRNLKAVNLAEVSIVDEPSNTLARVEAVKLAGRGDLETLLRKGGLSKKAASQITAGGWPALAGDPDPYPEPDDGRRAAAAEAFARLLERNFLDLKGLIS